METATTDAQTSYQSGTKKGSAGRAEQIVALIILITLPLMTQAEIPDYTQR